MRIAYKFEIPKALEIGFSKIFINHSDQNQFNFEITLIDLFLVAAMYLGSFNYVFLNGPTPASFLFIFGLFKQAIHFLQQINVKKCHVYPKYGAGIRTHDLSNMSRLPPDQGSSDVLSVLQLCVSSSTKCIVFRCILPHPYSVRINASLAASTSNHSA